MKTKVKPSYSLQYMRPENLNSLFRAQIKLPIFWQNLVWSASVYSYPSKHMHFFPQRFISHLWKNPLLSDHILNPIKNKSEKSKTLWKSFPSTLVLALVLVENQAQGI